MFRGPKSDASGSSTPRETPRKAPPAPAPATPLVKVALVGDSQVGKTSLMVRYVEGNFDETQLQTQGPRPCLLRVPALMLIPAVPRVLAGVNFMEKTVCLRSSSAGGSSHDVTFSIWDIGGHKDSGSMLPLLCNDAAVILLVFDLTRHETLDSIREWHRKARGFNKCAMPMLVGVKYDLLLQAPEPEHAHVEAMARRFAAAIDAPLVLCAPSVPINVTNIFKVRLTQCPSTRCQCACAPACTPACRRTVAHGRAHTASAGHPHPPLRPRARRATDHRPGCAAPHLLSLSSSFATRRSYVT